MVPVVQWLDSVIQQWNHHSADKLNSLLGYLMDSDLSSGYHYPPFEQLGPETCFLKVLRTFWGWKASGLQLLNCTPLVLKSPSFNKLLMQEKLRGLQIWWFRTLAMQRCKGNCGTRNRLKNFRTFEKQAPGCYVNCNASQSGVLSSPFKAWFLIVTQA